jgi:hypothetical protein
MVTVCFLEYHIKIYLYFYIFGCSVIVISSPVFMNVGLWDEVGVIMLLYGLFVNN